MDMTSIYEYILSRIAEDLSPYGYKRSGKSSLFYRYSADKKVACAFEMQKSMFNLPDNYSFTFNLGCIALYNLNGYYKDKLTLETAKLALRYDAGCMRLGHLSRGCDYWWNITDEILKDFGTCDILINGAGGNNPKATCDHEYFNSDDVGKMKTFFDLDPKGIEFVFNLNFLGTLLTTQCFAKDMVGRENATILNVSSMNSFKPLTRIPAYSAAKAAISNFTQWMAVHFAEVGIRVNAIAPGFFSTIQNAKLLYNEDGSLTERSNKIITHTPMRRFGVPEDLTGALVFLCDEQYSGFMTGVVLPVDGGFSAYSGV